jgi:signal transduction histidine kinase
MNYLLFKQKVFLYLIFSCSSITAFCVMRIFTNLNPYGLLPGEEQFSSLYGMVLFGFGMYYRFIRFFMDCPDYYPRLNKVFIFVENIVFTVGALLLLMGLFSLQYYSMQIFKLVFVLVLPFNLMFVIYLGTRGKMINKIIMLGTLISMFLVRISSLKQVFLNTQDFQLWNYQSILVSIIILFTFLNFGLIYKSRLQQEENLKLEYQKNTELSLQRTTISADLHDDLGASLSSIHLQAIMAQKTGIADLSKTNTSLLKIVGDLKSVMENMGDIVWAINADKKAFKSMSSQIKDFYFDLMDGYNIDCNYHIDEALELQITDINARKNLLLIAKEAINNILKHAQATQIDISLKSNNNHLLLEIRDNGIGMDITESNGLGYGLSSMRFRAEKINGVFCLISSAGMGTIISCEVPLTNIHYTVPRSI